MTPELAARASQGEEFRVGRWAVDPVAGELRDGDRIVRLRPKAMALLVALAARPGKLLSKSALLDTVWPDVVVGEASVSGLISELRHALGDTPRAPTYIETIPRRGYRLVADVSGLEPVRMPAAGSSSRFWLVGHELEVVLVEGQNVVGRAPDADLRIPSTKVSRHHARIVVDGDSAMIEDLGSKNGTFVGARRVEAPTPLSHGDEIRLGQMAATLRVVVVDRDSTVTELSRE
jgi:DNA-binding winged helix-turn-helix (wHTH) protein